MGLQENDASVSLREGLNGSFRKTRTGLSQHNDLDSSVGRSLDGSFRISGSVLSGRSLSDLSTTSKSLPSSRRLSKALKECARNLISLDLFTHRLETWVSENTQQDSQSEIFRSPFSIDELLNLDLALEGVPFKQLCRMPCSTTHSSNDTQEGHYLAIEDFLHAVMNGLWRTFWHKSRPSPFSVSCPRKLGSKFYTSVETAASRGRLEEIQGVALVLKSEDHSHWHQVIEFTLFRPNILSDNEELKLSPGIICEAIFFGVHILLARSLRNKLSITAGSRSFVYILVCDSTFGGMVKIEGDLSQLKLNHTDDPYDSVTEWIKCHSEIRVSPVDQVWNRLGNANWGDIGTLQVILATFYSMVESIGSPKKSVSLLASEHGLRVQKRKIERQVIRNESTSEIRNESTSEIRNEIVEVYTPKRLKLRPGEMLVVDDQEQGPKRFQIQESSVGGNHFLYSAVELDSPEKLLTLYVGAHPSKLEPCWEDMSLWYQVQRQTKVLNILKKKGSFHNRCLPEKVSSGRVLHSGQCTRQNPRGTCDHPICGTPVLVTSPLGEPISFIVAKDGAFRSQEAIRCCRDCLAGLGTAASANVLHGDICPENIVRFHDRQGRFSYLAISWGRAVLEEKDGAAINLQFSSSYALQNGKLCPSSDAESLVYVLLFVCGRSGTMLHDSIESALQWRERSWGERLIQRELGEVSPILKAFADYVDSLSGTPYPVEYEVWVERLSRVIDGGGSGDKGKMMVKDDVDFSELMLDDDEDVAESSCSKN